jgi:hypothetical protein
MQFLYHMGMWYSNLGGDRSPLAAVTITKNGRAIAIGRSHHHQKW